MTMKPILLAVLILCLMIDMGLIIFAATRPRRKRTAWFTMLCVVLMVYTLGYISEVNATTLDGAWASLLIENFAIPVLPWFFLLASISLFEPMKFRSWQGIAAFGYLIIFYLTVFTNPYHHLYYTNIEMVDGFLKLSRGSLHIANQVVSISCIIAAYFVLIKRFSRSSKKLRQQIMLFMAALAGGFGANLLNSFDILPTGLDLTPITLTLGQGLFAIGLVKNDILDAVVRARDLAVETMGDGLVILDNRGDFLYCNQYAMCIFPDLQHIKETESIEKVRNWPKQLLSHKEDTIIFELEEDGKTHSYRASIRKVQNWKNLYSLSIQLHDISEEMYLIERLQELATTDPLTGIMNRRHFIETAEFLLGNSKKDYAVILFDIDRFKLINDQYGHSAGDKVLKKVVDAICENLQASDLFCRYGGEEFVIISENTDFTFAKRLQKTVSDLVLEVQDDTVHITASFGMETTKESRELKRLLKHADLAMYEAKQMGRNRVVLFTRKSLDES